MQTKIEVASGGHYTVPFPVDQALFTRIGRDLQLSLGDGQELLLAGYYQAKTKPIIEDEEGQVYDIPPAPDDPEPEPQRSSSTSSERVILSETHYNDDHSVDSLDGVSHLGALQFSLDAYNEPATISFGDRLNTLADNMEMALAPARASAPMPAITVHEPEPDPALSVSVDEATGKGLIDIPLGWTIIEGASGTRGSISQVDGQWVYTLDHALAHEAGQGRNWMESADTVRLLMADPSGGARYVDVSVSVQDDIPTQSRESSRLFMTEKLSQLDDAIFYNVTVKDGIAYGHIRGDNYGLTDFRPGADGASFRWGDGEPDANGDFPPIVGKYGTLIGNIDGSYRYTSNDYQTWRLLPGETGEDVFHVRYVDTDGDEISHALTIYRGGTDKPIEIISKDIPVVWEPALPEGTAPDPAKTQFTGKLLFEAKDGIAKIGLWSSKHEGEIDLDLDGGEAVFETDSWKMAFRLTGEGELTYTFTLTGPVYHAPYEPTHQQDFVVTLVDRSGTRLPGILIPVSIMDDQPLQPEPKTFELTERGAISASIFDFLTPGADRDGTVGFRPPNGLNFYGIWQSDDEGNFSFAIDDKSSDFLSLRPGETVSFRVPYSFVDSDGDLVDGEIQIIIRGVEHSVSLTPEAGKDGFPTPEGGWPDYSGDSEGAEGISYPSNPDFGFDTSGNAFARLFESYFSRVPGRNRQAHGSIRVDAPDGLDELTVIYDGKTYDILGSGASIILDCGRLYISYDGTKITYSVFLQNGVEHALQGVDANVRKIAIHAVNHSGNQADGKLIIEVVDDIPRVYGFGTADDGSTWLDFTYGADKGDGSHVEVTAPDGTVHIIDGGMVEVAGQFGVLKMDRYGNYTYSGTGGQDTFKFAIVDADGDRVDVDQTGNPIEITLGEEPKEPIVLELSARAYENAKGEPVTLDIPDGFAIADGRLDGQYGHVEIADGKAVFVLDKSFMHDFANSGHGVIDGKVVQYAKGADMLELSATGQDGQPYIIKLSVDIIDDSPAVKVPESATMWGDETYHGHFPEGWFDFGGDDGEGKKIEIIFDGRTYEYTPGEVNVFGPERPGIDRTMTINPDGSFEILHGRELSTACGPIWVKVYDSDGDTATKYFHVDQAIVPWVSDTNWMDEIIGSEFQAATFSTLHMDSIEIVDAGRYGTARIEPWGNNDVQIIYTLEKPVDKREYGGGHINADAEHIVVKMSTGGNERLVDIYIDIWESRPSVSATLADGTRPTYDTMIDCGGAIDGLWNADYGADAGDGARLWCAGKRIEPGAEAAIEGEHGTLHLNADGTFHYESNGESGGKESFYFTIIDADGDQRQAYLIFTVAEPVEKPVEPVKLTITASEEAIGQAVILEVPDGVTLPERIDGQLGHVEMSGGKLAYVLDSGIYHPKYHSILKGADTLSFTARDTEGRDIPVDLSVNVVDGQPSVKAPGNGVMWGDDVYHGQLPENWFDFGADDGEGKYIQIQLDGKIFDYTPGQVNTFRGDGEFDPTLTIYPDRSFELGHGRTLSSYNHTIKLFVTDSDGSGVSGTFTVHQAIPPSDTNHRMNEGTGVELLANCFSVDPCVDSIEIIQQGNHGTARLEPASDGSGHLMLYYVLTAPLDKREFGNGYLLKAVDTILVRMVVGGEERIAASIIDVNESLPMATSSLLDGSQIPLNGADVEYGGTLEGRWHADYGVDVWGGQRMTCSGQEIDPSVVNVIRRPGGTLTLNPDGSFVFTADGNAGFESFYLKIVDADGDPSGALFNFNVLEPEAVTVDLTVDEASGFAEIAFPEGYAIQSVEKDGQIGKVTQTEDGKWIYTLDGPVDSGEIQGRNTVENADSVRLVLVDAEGNTATGAVSVDVKDDIPHIAAPGGSVLSGSSVSGQLELAYGADGPGSLTVNGQGVEQGKEIAGTFGTLTMNLDGSWSYQADPLAVGENGGTETFEIAISDSDRDTETASLVITVSKPDAPVITDHIVGDERVMSGGIFTGIPEGYALVGDRYTGACMEIVNQEGNAHFQMHTAYQHQAGTDIQTGAETITVRLADAAGNQWDVPIFVDIIDDAPEIHNLKDYETVKAGGYLGGYLDFTWGADDGPARMMEAKVNGGQYVEVGERGATLGGFNGTFNVNPDGSWSFQATDNPDARAKDELFFRITDADGDSVESWLGFEIEAPFLSAAGNGDALRESELYTGTAFRDFALRDGWMPDLERIEGKFGTLELIMNGEGDGPFLRYTLNGPFCFGDNDGFGEYGTDGFDISLYSEDGDTGTEQLKVMIEDDAIQVEMTQDMAATGAGIVLPEGWTVAQVLEAPQHGALDGLTYKPDVFSIPDGKDVNYADIMWLEITDGTQTQLIAVGVDLHRSEPVTLDIALDENDDLTTILHGSTAMRDATPYEDDLTSLDMDGAPAMSLPETGGNVAMLECEAAPMAFDARVFDAAPDLGQELELLTHRQEVETA